MCRACGQSRSVRLSVGSGQLHRTLDQPEISGRASKLDPKIRPEYLEAARLLLRQQPSIDIHCHPGRFFLRGMPVPKPYSSHSALPSPEAAIYDMHTGGLSCALFATVADNPLLSEWEGGLRATREFLPGEALADHRRQVSALQALIERQLLPQARDGADIRRAHLSGQSACMFSVEGGDFIEGHLERIAEARDQGVRSITIVHYHTNQIGDTQTESPSHGGLTELGREIIREMNGVGIIVDLAHASYAVSRDAAETSSRPMLISHTNLRRRDSDHPRLISLEHAQLVTRVGGVIGAVPAGFGQRSFGDYLDTIFRMVDALGVDHVAIGTDMDFTYQPVFTNYVDWPMIPAGLLAGGMAAEEVGKIIGGNFLRVLAATALSSSI